MTVTNDGVKVPGGFALTASAYRQFPWANNMAPKMASLFATTHAGGTNWRSIGSSVRELILAGEVPAGISQQISSFYRELAFVPDTRTPPSPFAAVPPPKTSPTTASPDSWKAASMSGASSNSSTPACDATPHSSPTVPPVTGRS